MAIRIMRFGVASAAAVFGLCAHASAHEEISFGRTGGGRVGVFMDFDMPLLMEPSFLSNLTGYVKADLGLAAITDDLVDQGLFTLDPRSFITIKLVAADPGVHIWQTGLSHQMEIGESYDLGNPLFHNHPIFQIDEVTGAAEYGLTFVSVDTAGIYADSDPFRVTFRPIPGPGAAALAAGVGLGVVRRRR